MHLVAAFLGLLLALLSQRAAAADFSVDIAPDLRPKRTAEEVAQLAAEHLAKPISRVEQGDGGEPSVAPTAPSVKAVRCVRYSDLIKLMDSEGNVLNHNLVWVVEAKGQFVNARAARGPVVRDEGYLVIDDETGNILGSGSAGERPPLKPPVPEAKEEEQTRFSMDQDIQPRMSRDEVDSIVRTLAGNSFVMSIRATRADRLGTPSADSREPDTRTVWVAEVQGEAGSDGAFYVLDDQTGEVLAHGVVAAAREDLPEQPTSE